MLKSFRFKNTRFELIFRVKVLLKETANSLNYLKSVKSNKFLLIYYQYQSS